LSKHFKNVSHERIRVQKGDTFKAYGDTFCFIEIEEMLVEEDCFKLFIFDHLYMYFPRYILCAEVRKTFPYSAHTSVNHHRTLRRGSSIPVHSCPIKGWHRF